MTGTWLRQPAVHSDASEKRATKLMVAWASDCTASPTEKIVPFRSKAYGRDDRP